MQINYAKWEAKQSQSDSSTVCFSESTTPIRLRRRWETAHDWNRPTKGEQKKKRAIYRNMKLTLHLLLTIPRMRTYQGQAAQKEGEPHAEKRRKDEPRPGLASCVKAMKKEDCSPCMLALGWIPDEGLLPQSPRSTTTTTTTIIETRDLIRRLRQPRYRQKFRSDHDSVWRACQKGSRAGCFVPSIPP